MNEELEYWQFLPRDYDSLGNHNSVYADHLINTTPSNDDVLLFDLEYRPDSVLPLEVSFNELWIGDSLYLIGCSYAEHDCRQNLYAGVYNGIDYEGMKGITLYSEIEVRGYSGSPIINYEGKCVGVLYGAYEPQNGQTELIFSPITVVKNTLKNKNPTMPLK